MANYPNPNRNLNTAHKGIAIADNTPFSPCAAVNAAVAGSLTVTWLDGTTSPYYFVVGSDNPVQLQMVGTGAAAAGLIALYNT